MVWLTSRLEVCEPVVPLHPVPPSPLLPLTRHELVFWLDQVMSEVLFGGISDGTAVMVAVGGSGERHAPFTQDQPGPLRVQSSVWPVHWLRTCVLSEQTGGAEHCTTLTHWPVEESHCHPEGHACSVHCPAEFGGAFVSSQMHVCPTACWPVGHWYTHWPFTSTVPPVQPPTETDALQEKLPDGTPAKT